MIKGMDDSLREGCLPKGRDDCLAARMIRLARDGGHSPGMDEFHSEFWMIRMVGWYKDG